MEHSEITSIAVTFDNSKTDVFDGCIHTVPAVIESVGNQYNALPGIAGNNQDALICKASFQKNGLRSAKVSDTEFFTASVFFSPLQKLLILRHPLELLVLLILGFFFLARLLKGGCK